MASMTFDEKAARRPVWTANTDGGLYVNDNFDAYEIKFYSPDAKLSRVATRDYQHRGRSKDEMEENKPRMMIRRGGGGAQAFDAKASETDPDVLQMFARDDGTVWVMSSRGAHDLPKGTLVRYDVFDANGHFLREVSVQGDGNFDDDGITIAGDRLVVLKGLRSAQRAMYAGMDADSKQEEEEAEPMAIVCYRLDAPSTAKK